MNPPVALEIKLAKRPEEVFSDSNVASFASNQVKMSVAQGQVPLEVIAAEENLLSATRAYETLTAEGGDGGMDVGLVDLVQLQQIEAVQVIKEQRPYFVKSIIPNAIFISKNHPWGQRLSRPNHAPYLGVQMYHDHPKQSTLVADSFLKLQSIGLHNLPGETGEPPFDDPTKPGNNRYLVQGYAPSTSQEGNLQWSQTPLARCNVEALPKERKAISQKSTVNLDFSLAVLQKQSGESSRAGDKVRDRRVYASIHPMPFPVIRLVFEQPRRIGLFYAVILDDGARSGGLPRIPKSFFLQQSLVLPSGEFSMQERQKISVVDACVTIPPVVMGIQTVNLPTHLERWRGELAAEGNLPRIPEGNMKTYLLQYFMTEHGRGTLSGLISPGAQIGTGRLHYGYAQALPNLDNQPLDVIHVSQGMISGVPLAWLSQREPRLFENTIYRPLLNILHTKILSRPQVDNLLDASVKVQFDMNDESILTANTEITFQATRRTWQYTSSAWPKLEHESSSEVQTFLRNAKASIFPGYYLPQATHGSQTSAALARGSGDVDGVPLPRLGNLVRIVDLLSGTSTESEKARMVTAWTKDNRLTYNEADQIVQQLSFPSASPLLKRYMALGAMIVQNNSFFFLRNKPLRLEGPNSTLYYAITAYTQQNDAMYLFLLVAFLLGETNFDEYRDSWPTLLVSQLVPWNQLYNNCVNKKIDISEPTLSELGATPFTPGPISRPPLAGSASVSPIDSSMVQGGFQLYRGRLEFSQRVEEMKKREGRKRRSQETQTSEQSGRVQKVSRTSTVQEPFSSTNPNVSLGFATSTPTTYEPSSSRSQVSRFPSQTSSPLPGVSASAPATALPSATRTTFRFGQARQALSEATTPLARSAAPASSTSSSVRSPPGPKQTFQFGQSGLQQRSQLSESSGQAISSSSPTPGSTPPATGQSRPFIFGENVSKIDRPLSPSQPTPRGTEPKKKQKRLSAPSDNPPTAAPLQFGSRGTPGRSSTRYVTVPLPDNPRWPLE